jgi:hypothetical protein
MMEFLQPALLWGTLAVAIPIAIHFWHQKKGKVIAWAATQWLLEKSQQPQRGLHLDQLLLLALRCLILITLAFLLSEPLFKLNAASATLQKVHLVQPDTFVVDNYRFELKEAQNEGEAIYWLTPALSPADELTPPATDGTLLSGPLLQKSMNQLSRDGVELHLYVKNSRRITPLPFIQTPIEFELHSVPDTVSRAIRPYRVVADNQKLYINANNRLRVGTTDAGVTFTSGPVGTGPLRIHLDLKNPDERKTVEAALRAFSEVYGLELNVGAQKMADVSITNLAPATPQPGTLYVVTGQTGFSAQPNVVYTPEPLTPQTSSMVATGRLPEWLGQHILDNIGLNGDLAPLTETELTALYNKPTKRTSGESSATTQRIFFIVLLVLVCIERGIALTRNA